MEQQHNKHRNSKRVVWDQQKLKQTQKLRGTFPKIDEPKTPYVKRNQDDSGEEDNSTTPKSEEQIEIDHNLQVAKHNQQVNAHKKINLEELNAQLEKQLSGFRSQEDMEDEQQEAKRKRQQQFKKKRASHYNQFQMIQRMKNHGWEQDEDQQG